MKKLKYLLFLLLFIPGLSVKADIIANTSTSYYYSDTTDVTHTTGFRTNPSTVELFGKENYSPTYDDYEYLTGFDVYIPYNINEGSVYTVKVTWTISNWSPDEFVIANFNARLNGTAITGAVNGIISNQKTTYFTNNCSNYSGTQYCDYVFTTTYTFTATTTNTAFRVGTYNNKAFSLIGAAHYLTSIASVKEVDVITNNDSTIINQNEQIIDQNKQTNDKLNDLNDNITNDNIDDSQASSFFDNFTTTDHGGISSIINAPLVAIKKMLDKNCSPLSATYKGKQIELPCGYDFWSKMAAIKTFINLTLGGMLCYNILRKLYHLIENMKNPDDDRVEVMKL